MPDLPEVSSLWRHKDGERRFVTSIVDGCLSLWYSSVPLRPELHTGEENLTTLADWLAWQQGAVRIDREEE